jgi:ribosomal protein L12E/L44/L45/RPP1/RPP2
MTDTPITGDTRLRLQTTTIRDTATTPAEPSLPDLATRIRVGHTAVIEAKKNIVRKAIEVGGWLKQAKDSPEMKHGQWLPWLKANCPEISERTAQRYMELAGNKEPLEEAMKLKSAAMADFTLAGAAELLKSPLPEAEDDDQAEEEEAEEEETEEEETEASGNASDKIDKIADRLIAALKALNDDETARACASDVVQRLQDAGFLERKKKAA